MSETDAVTLDLSVFRVKEMRLIAQQTGMKFGEAMKQLTDGNMDEDIIAAFALVALRRKNPTATPEEAEEVNVMSMLPEGSLNGNGAKPVPPTEGAEQTP